MVEKCTGYLKLVKDRYQTKVLIKQARTNKIVLDIVGTCNTTIKVACGTSKLTLLIVSPQHKLEKFAETGYIVLPSDVEEKTVLVLETLESMLFLLLDKAGTNNY